MEKKVIRLTDKMLREMVSRTVRMILEDNLQEKPYIIKEYYPNTPEWDYIVQNKKQLWKFLDDGYRYAGYRNGFIGCPNDAYLVKKPNLMKIAFCGETIVAVSVYTGYRGGFKCVGATVTTDAEYRKIGVDALNEIVDIDISKYKEFYWIECSGKMETIYEKHGGFKIPSSMASSILKADVTIIDEWHYERNIGNSTEPIEKIIYGFNSKDTYDIIRHDEFDRFENWVKWIENRDVNESYEHKSFGKFTEVDCADGVINAFLEFNMMEGVFDFPKELLDKLMHSVKVLEKHLRECEVDPDKAKTYRLLISAGRDLYDSSVPMEMHLFKREG